LVLGKNSGIVAIDVDGDSGKEILKEMSKGDLPDLSDLHNFTKIENESVYRN
jgi:hypothetical protein